MEAQQLLLHAQQPLGQESGLSVPKVDQNRQTQRQKHRSSPYTNVSHDINKKTKMH
jgi:hypothetical protein